MKRLAAVIPIILSMSCAAVRPQAPAETAADPGFRNLQVLPRDITRPELITTMRRFTQALGVGCDYCHVANPAGTEPEMNFASDAKQEKNVARLMIRMTGRINEGFIARVPDSHTVVTCWTCHRGEAQPVDPPPLPPRRSQG